MDNVFLTRFGNPIRILDGYREQMPPMFDPSFYNPNTKPAAEGDFGILADICEFARMTGWICSLASR